MFDDEEVSGLPTVARVRSTFAASRLRRTTFACDRERRLEHTSLAAFLTATYGQRILAAKLKALGLGLQFVLR